MFDFEEFHGGGGGGEDPHDNLEAFSLALIAGMKLNSEFNGKCSFCAPAHASQIYMAGMLYTQACYRYDTETPTEDQLRDELVKYTVSFVNVLLEKGAELAEIVQAPVVSEEDDDGGS